MQRIKGYTPLHITLSNRMGHLVHESCSRLLFDTFRSGHVVHSPIRRWCRVVWYTVQLTDYVGSRGTQSNSQMVSGHVVHSPSRRWCRIAWYTVQLTDDVGSRGIQSNSQMESGHVVHSPSRRWCRVAWYTVQLPDDVGSHGTWSNSQMVSGHVVHIPTHRRCRVTWYIVQSKMVPRVQRYSNHSVAVDKLKSVTKLYCSSSSWQSFLTTTKRHINVDEGCPQPSVVTSCNSRPSSSFIRHDLLLVR
jgi:hypothetical protein